MASWGNPEPASRGSQDDVELLSNKHHLVLEDEQGQQMMAHKEREPEGKAERSSKVKSMHWQVLRIV